MRRRRVRTYVRERRQESSCSCFMNANKEERCETFHWGRSRAARMRNAVKVGQCPLYRRRFTAKATAVGGSATRRRASEDCPQTNESDESKRHGNPGRRGPSLFRPLRRPWVLLLLLLLRRRLAFPRRHGRSFAPPVCQRSSRAPPRVPNRDS